MFGIRYIKVPPTTYVQQYKAGRVRREGAELKEQTQVVWNANYLYYSVREPFPSKHSSTNLVFGKITYEPIGFNLLEEEFSIPQLKALYEVILDKTLTRRNFSKKILSMGLLVPTRPIKSSRGHPTQLYKFDRNRYDELQERGFAFEI